MVSNTSPISFNGNAEFLLSEAVKLTAQRRRELGYKSGSYETVSKTMNSTQFGKKFNLNLENFMRYIDSIQDDVIVEAKDWVKKSDKSIRRRIFLTLEGKTSKVLAISDDVSQKFIDDAISMLATNSKPKTKKSGFTQLSLLF